MRLRRVALATAAIFFLLALSSGALHQHGSPSSLHRIDCQACAWVHSASGALSHAAPVLILVTVSSAHPAPSVPSPASTHASPRRGRAPPFSLV